PASNSTGCSGSRRKKEPIGPSNSSLSPTFATSFSQLVSNPSEVFVLRITILSTPGPVAQEQERVSVASGTLMLTYSHGRKYKPSRSSTSSSNSKTVSVKAPTLVTSALKVSGPVLANTEVVRICKTISERGLDWHGKQKPLSSSSWVIASSTNSPSSKSPDSQNALQVPQAPSRQSKGILILDWYAASATV